MDYVKLYKIQNESLANANRGIEALLDKGAGVLYMKYVVNKIPDFVADIYNEAFMGLVDELTLEQDKGDDFKDIYRFWKEEDEPEASRIDSWARYRINIERKPPVKDQLINIEGSEISEVYNASHISTQRNTGRTNAQQARANLQNLQQASNRIRSGRRIPSASSKGSKISKEKKRQERERRFSYNSYHSNPETIDEFLNAPLFDVYVKAKEIPKNELLKERIYLPEKEEKYRKDNLEKERKLQEEREYERLKEEEKLENEQKKKEIKQNLQRRNFTFGYDGKIIFLKPQKDAEILVNDITEVGHDSSKKAKIQNPDQKDIPIVEVEILERENDDEKIYFKSKPEKKSKKPKIVGQFKPQPPLKDIFQVAPGVMINYGKGKPISGGTFKLTGRMRKKDFQKKHKKISEQKVMKKFEGSTTLIAKRKAKQEERKQRYQRTIDNWKEDIKKGLMGRGIEFDPDMLIKLIMTEDDPYMNQKRIERRQHRLEQKQKELKFKRKLKHIMEHKDKYFNRITSFTKDLGSAKNDQEEELLISKFQKEIRAFNKDLREKRSYDSGFDNYEPPETSEDRERRQYQLPKAKADLIRKHKIHSSQYSVNKSKIGSSKHRKSSSNAQSQFILNKHAASKARMRVEMGGGSRPFRVILDRNRMQNMGQGLA